MSYPVVLFFDQLCKLFILQEILVVAIGKSVLRIDTTKVRKGVEFSAEEPLVCPLDKLIDGVQLVGKHEGEVTDLSMCQWMTTRLVSASKDGTVCHVPTLFLLVIVSNYKTVSLSLTHTLAHTHCVCLSQITHAHTHTHNTYVFYFCHI